MTSTEAVLILINSKPYIKKWLDYEITDDFLVSMHETKILQQLQKLDEAGFLKDNELLEGAGYSIIEAAVLLGVLEHFKI